MNSDQLEKFIVISQTKSISESAKILYMTQSGLSHALSSLEEELNCKLFIRQPHKKLELTSEGEKLLSYATTITNLMSQIKNRLCEKKYINISAVNICSAYILNHLPASQLNYIHLINVKDKDMPQMIYNGTLDIAICDDRFVNEYSSLDNLIMPVRKQIICKEQVGFLVNENSWMYNKESITINELGNEELCMQTSATALSEWLKDITAITGHNFNIVFTIDNYSFRLMQDYINYPQVVILNSVYNIREHIATKKKYKFVRLKGPYTERFMYMWYLQNIESKIQPLIDSLNKNYTNNNNLQ